MKTLKRLAVVTVLFAGFTLVSCSKDEFNDLDPVQPLPPSAEQPLPPNVSPADI